MKSCNTCVKPLSVVIAEAVLSRSGDCVQCERSIDWDMNMCMCCWINHNMPRFKKGSEGHMNPDATSPLINDGCMVVSYHVEGWWKDTGNPEDILEASHLILDGVEARNDGKVEDRAAVVGRVKIGAGTIVMGRSVTRGPAVVGENCRIGPNAYRGPSTAAGDNCTVSSAELDESIVMDGSTINVERKFVRSMIGKESKILSSNGMLPKGERLVVGKNTTIYL